MRRRPDLGVVTERIGIHALFGALLCAVTLLVITAVVTTMATTPVLDRLHRGAAT